MIFELQIFNPENYKSTGFKSAGLFSSVQECHDKASIEAISFYRIEQKGESISRKVFMSDLPKPPEPEVILEPEVISEPESEVVTQETLEE